MVSPQVVSQIEQFAHTMKNIVCRRAPLARPVRYGSVVMSSGPKVVLGYNTGVNPVVGQTQVVDSI